MKHQFIFVLVAVLLVGCKGDQLISSINVKQDEYPMTTKRWGFINRAGEVTIPLKYQEIRDFHEGRAAFRAGYLWGYIDSTGQESIKPMYLQANSFYNQVAKVVTEEGKTIFIDPSGKSAFPIFCSRAGNFNDNRAPIWQNNLVGYINPKGRTVINPQFEDGYGFQNDMAIVKANSKFGVIDRYGSYVLTPKYSFIYRDPQAKSAIFLVRDSKGTRFYDVRRKTFITENFSTGKAFYDASAVVQKDSLYGAINTNGDWLLMPIFSDLVNLGNHRWALQYEQEYFMIDSSGLQYGEGFKQLYRFSEGLAKAQIDHKWGFVDTSGEFVISPHYELVWSFQDGLARIVTDEGVGFIDKSGSFVIPPLMGEVRDFEGGFARLGVE